MQELHVCVITETERFTNLQFLIADMSGPIIIPLCMSTRVLVVA